MLVSCASCGKESKFTAYDSEALAAAHYNTGSRSNLGASLSAAKTAFVFT